MSAVVFDLDGTLVDSAPDMHAAMNRVLQGRGHAPLDLAQVRSFIGNGVPTLVRRVMAAVGVDDDAFDAWHGDYMGWYAKLICDRTQPYPSVIEALDSLRASGHRLGICTNKPQQLTEDLIAALGLTDLFGAVVGGDTEFGHKPAPGPLTETVRRLGGGPAVMVGDSMADAGAARAAGLPLILYTGGYRDRGVDEIAPDARFDHWDALPGLVAEVMPRP